jgi:hypothetical protein
MMHNLGSTHYLPKNQFRGKKLKLNDYIRTTLIKTNQEKESFVNSNFYLISIKFKDLKISN